MNTIDIAEVYARRMARTERTSLREPLYETICRLAGEYRDDGRGNRFMRWPEHIAAAAEMPWLATFSGCPEALKARG